MHGFAVMCACLFVAGVIENWLHTRRLSRISVRIHVNGTRGKSTITRLIAAGLRAGGMRVIAKTTGTAARIIFEDGSEEPVVRRGNCANISEQMRLVKLAESRGADAIVVECMALQPENQWAAERHMIKSTVGVITNVRDDHLDVMGPTVHDVAEALSLTVPYGGALVTAEQKFLHVFEDRARKTGASVYVVDASGAPADATANFDYISFPENIACALKVCELCGVPRDLALEGMLTAQGDPGATRILRIDRGKASYVFVNAFAANDRDSTELVCKAAEGRIAPFIRKGLPAIVILNNRSDRPFRAEELAGFVAESISPQWAFVVGEAGRVAVRGLKRGKVAESVIVDLTHQPKAERILAKVADRCPAGAVIYGIGNTRGMGERIIQYFEANGVAL
ncbi:MAG TPA: poly-gamma-glutamate synthase PgsB [Bacillota bacterium]|jgi:poly-gamma-glutamate synthase PgsB/CapB|nr:poly-gamma-glutamate synthase PgsB [Bacillota bacterium]